MTVILSVFPGIDLLGRAFEEEWPDACLVRGPDVLWGGDIRRFHPPAGVFDAVIGGPPCQAHSAMVHMIRAVHGDDSVAEDLIPEFLRVVDEAQPDWFLMENAPGSPIPRVDGYHIQGGVLNNRQFGGIQTRTRRISFGSKGYLPFTRNLDIWTVIAGEWEHAVLSTSRTIAVKLDKNHKQKPGVADSTARTIGQMLDLQGLPPTLLDDAPFTDQGKRRVIANGVPLPMGRAIARAVRRAMEGT